jgi:beta-fructofuranosidase
MKRDRRVFLKSLACGAASRLLLAQPRLAWSLASSNQIADIAHDPLRPEYHLLPQHNWMNDPNGPIWWKGQYHLFYQLNPHAAVWGDMHWGHAVSLDMVHWKHQPIALAPTPGGADSEGCFSGSAVVFDGKPTFIFTGVQNAPPAETTLHDGNDKLRETQMLAVAQDENLLHWKKLETPIIATPPQGIYVTGFRDPCLWQEADIWYLGIGSGERTIGGCVLLYRSRDLRHWEYLHKLVQGKANGRVAVNPCDSGEMWECPDFFTVNGRHCLLYSTEDKVFWTTGEYDALNHRYIPMRIGVLDHGAYYAPKSFLAADTRRILWGWIRETRPEAQFAAAGWSGAMALPRLLTVNDEGQLVINPAVEVEKLRGAEETSILQPDAPIKQTLNTLRRELHISLGDTKPKLSIRLLTNGKSVWELVVDTPSNLVTCAGITFAMPPQLKLDDAIRIFIDGSVIESFIAGREALTSRVYDIAPNSTELQIELVKGRSVKLSQWPLQAISPDRLTT